MCGTRTITFNNPYFGSVVASVRSLCFMSQRNDSRVDFSFKYSFSDENRDINIHHVDDDIKRQRIQYNGDQLYPNVSSFQMLSKLLMNELKLQIWSSKWCIKDEPKQQQILQQQQQLTSDITGSPVISISTPPHNNNNNNSTNNSNTPNNTSTASGANNGSSNNNNSSYYDTHNVFPTSVNNNNNQDTILYDSISSISQAQNTLYAPSIGTAIGKFNYELFFYFRFV